MDTASAGHGPHPADDRSRGTHDRPGDRPPDTALRDGGVRSPYDAFRAVLCGDGLRRCPWAPTGPAALEEHDRRWGARPADSSGWFEALGLEIFQAGLARWSIAQRREGLRRALRDFVPEEIARMTEDDVDELLLDPAVIRNRVKIEAVVHNALAPKSNAAYAAINAAVADVRAGKGGPVPPHLRGSGYAGAARLGHGEGYRYSHDEPAGVGPQQFLPDDLLAAGVDAISRRRRSAAGV